MATAKERHAVRVGPSGLPGDWTRPARALGLVVFVHGSGSSRNSPRNLYVANVLQDNGLATLLFDLLDEGEAQDRARVFDIALLTQRLLQAMEWLGSHEDKDGELGRRPLGLFGASTGAAAAMQAAAAQPGRVSALVLRGGRVDLAPQLARVQAPTMLVVGGADTSVLRANRRAMRDLSCEKRLEVVPGATHLFEEPGALEAVAHLAADWFVRHSAYPH